MGPIALWIYIGVTVIVDIVAYIYWKHLLSQGADSRYVEPYIVELNFSSKENLYSKIENCVELIPMYENVKYGYKKGRRNIRLFITEMPEYNEQEYENIDGKMVRNAIENHGMKTELNRQEMYKAIRLNILLLEKFNDEAYKSAKKNALYGTQNPESVIDVIADIEKKKLYIPAYWGIWYGGSAKYRYCIKQMLGWLAN